MKELLEKTLKVLEENHKHHQEYDEHGGYPDSQLALDNVSAIAALRGAIADQANLQAAATPYARDAAFEHRESHSYLPQTSAEAAAWRPHSWVLVAMVRFHMAQERRRVKALTDAQG